MAMRRTTTSLGAASKNSLRQRHGSASRSWSGLAWTRPRLRSSMACYSTRRYCGVDCSTWWISLRSLLRSSSGRMRFRSRLSPVCMIKSRSLLLVESLIRRRRRIIVLMKI